jgi:hypothetical protein
MRTRPSLIASCLVLGCGLSSATEGKFGALVPDEVTAKAIALAVLTPLYGPDLQAHRKLGVATHLRPQILYARRHGTTWVVENAPPDRRQWVSPVLSVRLDAQRGCVLSIKE